MGRGQTALARLATGGSRSYTTEQEVGESRADWLLLRQQGAERGEAGRARKRARQKDSQGPEAMKARRPIVRALDVLIERGNRQELELGRTASKGGATLFFSVRF